MAKTEKSAKLTLTELKRHLRELTKEESIDLICRLYKSGPDAVRLLNAEFNRENYTSELYKETVEKIHREFFPNRGNPRLSLRDAKTAITTFQKVCTDTAMVLDVQIYYVECGVEFTKQYGESSEAFYSSMGKMFSSVVETMIKLDDETMFRRFENRMRQLMKISSLDAGFEGEFSAFYNLKWVNDTAQTDKALRPAADPATGPTLLPENAERYFNLTIPLQQWLNKKHHLLPELGDSFTQKNLNAEQIYSLMDYLWSHPEELDFYLADCGGSVTDTDRAEIEGLKRFVKGRFVIERYLKAGAILIPTDDSGKVYLVSGITSEIESIFPKEALPALVQTTLIPFMGRIIYDGVMMPFSIYFGSGIRRSLKDTYLNAKRDGRILTKL